MKKIVALLLAAVMVCGLCACGETTPASTSTSTSSAETTVSASTETSTEPAPEPAAEQISLKMWCIATESDSNYPSYVKAIEEVTAAHPEINFEWEATENEAYKTKIKAAAAANELPDIFFTWGGAFLGDFVKADRVYCLDDAYKAFAADLPESMLDNTTYGGKHYGVPLTMNVVGLFANMDMLAEVGYTEVPKTYDELIDCCDKLVAAGKIPFGCSGKETWCVTEYIEPLLEKT
ncbi:MAG: extracellular solute-binding protein, partial [Lachnospiraceae bacterium]|nr:extracellular solute-binding protein [Lachnospiraceae bacterium]